jgi:uncharacterized protein (DUF433 family)
MKEIDIDPEKSSGKPCLKDHRIPIAQILAEVLDTEEGVRAINIVAENYDLDSRKVFLALNGLADYFYRPFDPIGETPLKS